MPRPSGSLLFDSPQFTRKLVSPFEAMGGISKILLTHRDDVAAQTHENPFLHQIIKKYSAYADVLRGMFVVTSMPIALGFLLLSFFNQLVRKVGTVGGGTTARSADPRICDTRVASGSRFSHTRE